jgi:hypothetical protein
MLKIFQFLKYLNTIDPQKTPVRLSLYNFIKNLPDHEADLGPEIFNLFFNYALDYPHWEQNKLRLGQEVLLILQQANKYLENQIEIQFIKFPQDVQVIEIENTVDFLSCIQNYLKKSLQEMDQLRIIPDGKKAIALIYNKELTVRIFDRKFCVRKGQFEPLRTDLILHYTSQLELKSGVLQKFEIAPYVMAQFTVQNRQMTGSLMRGYVFQKYHEMVSEPFTAHAKLFYPLKRVEQFFVERKSDPYYNELIENVEKMIHLLQVKDPRAVHVGEEVLQEAENALEQLFNSDKLLSLLVKDLRHTLVQTVQDQKLQLGSEKINWGQLNGFEFKERSQEKVAGDECQIISPLPQNPMNR